jgi:DNA-directed RNA polymerase subunit M/transcription elongation factor TFIIS
MAKKTVGFVEVKTESAKQLAFGESVFNPQGSAESDNSDSDENEEYVNSKRKNKLINEFSSIVSIRKKAYNQLFKYIKNKAICKKIELGIIRYTNKMCTKKICYQAIYSGKLRDLIANINPDSSIGNKNLIKNILDKNLVYQEKPLENYDDIPFMKPEELFPDRWMQQQNRKKIKEDKLKNIATSDAYPCGRCKKSRASVSPPVQLRSSDEPMTVFVTCLECGLVFKIN